MKSQCEECKSRCCTAGLDYSAIFSKEEYKAIKEQVLSDKKLSGEVEDGDFCYYDEKLDAYKMRKFEDNKCFFLDKETYLCKIYDTRPLDCKVFPLEYRWFRWIFSPECPAKKCKKEVFLDGLKNHTKKEIVHLKLLHIKTPESTRDKLWIFTLKVLPITKLYSLYEKIFYKKSK